MSASEHDPERLVAEVAWLRSLARSLVRDVHAADDLAQSTLLAAVERRPRSDTSLRGWLATVLRRFFLQTERARVRRERREERAAGPEARTMAAGWDERLDAHERLLHAVKALDEPYRSTVMLHFFEGLGTGAIARRFGVPEATVRTRMHRALGRLRARLDREQDGDARAWLLALAPGSSIAANGAFKSAVVTALQGVLAVNTKLLCACGIVGVAATATVCVLLDTPGSRTPDVTRAAAAATAADAQVPDARETNRTEIRALAPAPAKGPGSDPAPATPSPDAWVDGRVVDGRGQSCAGVVVQATHGLADAVFGPTARSDGDGRFRLALRADPAARLIAMDPQYVTVFAPFPFATQRDGAPDGSTGPAVLLVVSRAITLRGTVANEDGDPVSDARVEFVPPQDLRSRLGVSLEHARAFAYSAPCDAAGRFELARVPALDGATFEARAVGYVPFGDSLPDADTSGLAIVLRRPHDDAQGVAGCVIDRDGRPVEDALVGLRGTLARTDAHGRFLLPIAKALALEEYHAQFEEGRRPADGDARIIAVKPGNLPGVYVAPVVAGEAQFPPFVVITLEDPALTIEGRVVDENDQPLADARVWVDDPTIFGLEAGGDPVLLENVLAGSPRDGWRSVQADSAGRFVVDGLADREYRVVALDPGNVAESRVDGVRGGARDVVLRIDGNDVHPRVRGRVVANDGSGVAGARIRATRDAFRLRGGYWCETGARTVTDADGRFELIDVPTRGVYLRIDGENLEPAEYGHGSERLADAGPRVDDVTIHVFREVPLRVELTDARCADSFTILDGDGKALHSAETSYGGRVTRTRVNLADGRSGVVVVRETAATLVLWKDFKEVRRVAMHLAVGASGAAGASNEVQVVRG